MSKKKKRVDFITSMLNPNNWKPAVSQIHNETGRSRDFIRAQVKERLSQRLIEVQILENTESVAKAKREAI